MKLSVIIVNYNVKYFLSNCLQSVYKAMENLEGEIIVVDNQSKDGSNEYIESLYPGVKLIKNDFNAGFSKANNQAIEMAKGEYLLLLNPDTVVTESCFQKCITYMDAHPKAGGLGVKMIDGSGAFLPESKRGLPTPLVAFYKVFGLSRLFPKSRKFGAYHLGYLPMDEINEIDVLSGAFMWLRKSVIDQIGGLDESFFMYGEDIDLSYRIVKAGYKNIYFPKTEIIHFKGESTKKSSVNYVLVFYRAMIIFAKKHFSNPNARLFSLLINTAVYFRAFLALIKRLVERSYMPLLDGLIMWLFLSSFKSIYEQNVIGEPGYYLEDVEFFAFPSMVIFWVFTQWIFGGYHQPSHMKKVFKGLFAAATLIFISYAMLDEKWRFSRAIVASSVMGSFILLPLLRMLLNGLNLYQLERMKEITTGIVGGPEEINAVDQILHSSAERKKKLIFIDPLRKSENSRTHDFENYTASLYQLKDLIKVKMIDELIFCMKDISVESLIETMQFPHVRKLGIYLKPADGNYMLKSSSIHSIGDYILPDDQPEMKAASLKSKRLLEFFIALIMLCIAPIMLILYRNPLQFIKNMWMTLLGKTTLVGSALVSKNKPYILSVDRSKSDEDLKRSDKLKLEYINHYGIERDLEIWLSNLNLLDQVPILES